MKKIKNNCTSCGAPLVLTETTKFIECKFCGQTYTIELDILKETNF